MLQNTDELQANEPTMSARFTLPNPIAHPVDVEPLIETNAENLLSSADREEFEIRLDRATDEHSCLNDDEVVLTVPLKFDTFDENFNASFQSISSRRSSYSGRASRRSSFTKERRASLNSIRSKLSLNTKDTEDDDGSVFSTGSEDSMDVTERRLSSVASISISKSDMAELQQLFESSDMP